MVYEYPTAAGTLRVEVNGEPPRLTTTKEGHFLAYTRDTLKVTSEWIPND